MKTTQRYYIDFPSYSRNYLDPNGKKIRDILRIVGCYNIRKCCKFGFSNQPDVLTFSHDKLDRISPEKLFSNVRNCFEYPFDTRFNGEVEKIQSLIFELMNYHGLLCSSDKGDCARIYRVSW